jgi:hypothetical protein
MFCVYFSKLEVSRARVNQFRPPMPGSAGHGGYQLNGVRLPRHRHFLERGAALYDRFYRSSAFLITLLRLVIANRENSLFVVIQSQNRYRGLLKGAAT